MNKRARKNKDSIAAVQEQPLLRRLILAVILIQALTLGVLIWNGMHQHDASHFAAQQHYARSQSVLLSAAVVPYLLQAGQEHKVLQTLSALREDERLRYAAVYDVGQQLIASLGTPPTPMQDIAGEIRERYSLLDGVWVAEQPIIENGQVLGIVQLGYEVTGPSIPSRQVGLQNTIIALLGLLLAIAASAVLILPLERDLSRLLSAIQALRRGEWQHRVATSKVLAPLARALNALAAKAFNDQTELSQRSTQLAREAQTLKALFRESKAVLWEADPSSASFSYVDDEAERLLGYPASKWISPDFIEQFVHPNDREWLQDFFAHPGNSSDGFSMELRLLNSEQQWRWLHLVSNVETRNQGPVLVGLLTDVSEQKLNEVRAVYLSDHDLLTELSNRRRFHQRIQDQVAVSQRSGKNGALLYLDLKWFHELNIAFGDDAGDDCLRYTVQRLRQTVGERGMLARLDSDSFGILLPESDADEAIRNSIRLLTDLQAEPFIYDGYRLLISARIGIVIFPEHGDKASSLLGKANFALLQAKQQGCDYRVFEEDNSIAVLSDDLIWQSRIKRVLDEERLQLFFRPIVDISSGVIRQYAALVNAVEDDEKVLDPKVFHSITERFDLGDIVDIWVLKSVLQTQSHHLDIGGQLAVTVTLSRRLCSRPDVLGAIRGVLRHHGAAPGSLVFKISVPIGMQNPVRIGRLVRALHELGHSCAWSQVDNNLLESSELKDIPVKYIELDSGLVNRLPRSEIDRAVLKKVVEFTRNLDAHIIAAGVDNARVRALLKEYGVGMGYGDALAKPTTRFHMRKRVVFASGDD